MISGDVVEQRVRDLHVHVVADGHRFILMHPHVVDGNTVGSDSLLVAKNIDRVSRHCRRLLERTVGLQVSHSHTLRRIVVQHPVRREGVLSLFGGVLALARATTRAVCQAGSLRDDWRRVTVHAGRLTQLGEVHLLRDVVVEDVL